MSNGRQRASRCRASDRAPGSRRHGTPIWRRCDAQAGADEQAALTAARLFTDYLRACRDERFAMSLLPPGRFLMPGSLAGSPALTFAPLDLPDDGTAPEGSLWAMMVRRYEAYKDIVVRPFFRDHFARLDRQVVLVDALSAFNAGPEALHDLEAALGGILDCFRIGRPTFFSSLFRPRIDRILFAATKADHLHHSSHDRLEAVLRRMVGGAVARAQDTGAAIDVVAFAAVRATREADGRARPRQAAFDPGNPRPRREGRWRGVRRQHRGCDLSRRSAGRSGSAVCGRRCVSRPLQRGCRKDRLSLPALPPAAARMRECGSPPCLTSALTAPSSS